MGGRAESREPKVAEDLHFYKIPANLYQPNEIIGKDLYLLYQGQYILYRPKNLLWQQEDSDRLKEFNVHHLYIQCDSVKTHHHFLEVNLSKIIDQPNIDSQQKSQVIYETSQAIISDIFKNPNSPETVRRSVSFVKNSVDFLKTKENFLQLMKFAVTSFSEYTHALQVSAYSIALAQSVGMKTFNDLSAIGVGSILHDVGKTKINNKILEKAEILSEHERKEVERHPEYGYEILQKQRTIPELSELIVLQHHERPTGNGYPYRLGSDMILSAKIVSVGDCFDSLTSDRPYKSKMKAIDAIRYMQTEVRDDYDQNLLMAFVKVLGMKG